MLADHAVPAGCEPAELERSLRWNRALWTPAELSGIAAAIERRGAEALATIPLERRLAAWNAAIEALLDPESDLRRELFPLLVDSSRLSPEGLTEALEVVLGGWRGEPAKELAERARTAVGRPPAGVVLAGNVPGLAAQSLLPALLAGRPLLVKSASVEPLFAPALVAALAAVEPAIGEAVAAVAFPGQDTPSVESYFGPATTVLAYGGDEALTGLRSALGKRLTGQGPKASVALVAGEIDALGVGRALARDVSLLDQRGCLSVHAVYVEGDARELAETLAFGLAIEHRRLPPGPIEPRVAALVQQWRGAAELGNALIGDLDLREGSILLAPEPEFKPSPGARTVRVHAVREISDAVTALAPWAGRLQGAALAGEAARALAPQLAALGVSRTAEPGRLQSSDAGWANGGVDPFEVLG